MSDYHFFILSTGRTGTTLLSQVLSKNKIKNIKHQERGSRILNIIGNLNSYKIIDDRYVINILINRFGNGTFPYSTSDPLRSQALKILVENSDKDTSAKFKILHLIRDPRSFVSSFMNWKKSSLKRTILHHCIPFWQPSPILDNDISLFERMLMSKFEHFCWVWNFKNRLFKELNDGINNYFLLRFEDLIDEQKKGETLAKLSNFMRIDIMSEKDNISESKKVNSSSKKHFPEWNKWTKEQAQTLHFHCGDLMAEYGYGNEDEWKKLIE